MTDVHVLRVFAGSNGKFGDTATVVIDEGRKITDVDRQTLATRLNTGETAFVNDVASADISIMHPQGEIGFAGVAALGTAWLLAKLSPQPMSVMKSRDGGIIVSQDGEVTWVRASLAAMPPWHHRQLESVRAVERITSDETKTWEHTMVWAWLDEANGLIRARTFAADWDIPEAEGNGSGAMLLADELNRAIEIRHGKGSVMFAKPAPNACADLGGRVVEAQSIRV